MLDPSIIRAAFPRRASKPVAHYTRIGTLCHFMPAGTGWTSARATPVQFLNDRLELVLGLETLRDRATQIPSSNAVQSLIQQLLDSAGGRAALAFQMSFSGNSDELGQWRGYAANGMGCAVVTDPAAVRNVADVGGWVLYDHQAQSAFADRVLRGLQGVANVQVMEQVLVAAASYMKHEGFKQEEEFRLLVFPDPAVVCFRESGDRLVPYVDFLTIRGSSLPVSEIVVGPGWHLTNLKPNEFDRHHVVQGIQRLLAARGLHSTQIRPSRIPYDPE
jgi:hypothetical protein